MTLEFGHQTRILVVDDSAFMRKIITDILSSDDDLLVVDTAKNGLEAIEKVKELKPDVVTLDVEMPVMDGLTCIKELNKFSRIPVVMLSSFTIEEAEDTIKALEIGAVDFITKPTRIFDAGGEEKKRELIEKVKVASKCVRKKRLHTPVFKKTAKAEGNAKTIRRSGEIKHIIALGTSTGGPKALQDVIPRLPGDIPAAFLIVQHMPAGFTRSLAERLNSLSEVSVKEAEDGEHIKPGFVYIAPGDYHMIVEGHILSNLKIRLVQTPPVSGHRPSVNVMMESLADTYVQNVIGVIMTGMGGDGSTGIMKIKQKNKGYIVAQDESTCVVYGMPKAAIQTGTVDKVVPLRDIVKEIMRIVGGYK